MYKFIDLGSEFCTLNLVIFKSGQNPYGPQKWPKIVGKKLWDSSSASQKKIENIHMGLTTFEIPTAVHHQVECDFISTPR